MKRKNRPRFGLFEKVLIIEHEHFKTFTGMIIAPELANSSLEGTGRLIVMVGDDEDIVLGLGPCRRFEAHQLKPLGKNLKVRVKRAEKRALFGRTF